MARNHESYMRRALELAERGWGRVSPNPLVGAVVVSDGVVVGEGWHEGPGTAHAEVMALREAGDRARGATVICTLEPCDRFGRTPPCTRALIDAGVSTVVVGATDPRGAFPTTMPYSPRDVLATMYRQMGVDWNLVFHDRSNRPMPILPDGRPIAELV